MIIFGFGLLSFRLILVSYAFVSFHFVSFGFVPFRFLSFFLIIILFGWVMDGPFQVKILGNQCGVVFARSRPCRLEKTCCVPPPYVPRAAVVFSSSFFLVWFDLMQLHAA